MKTIRMVWIVSIIIIIANFLFYTFRFGGNQVLSWISDLLPVLCSLISLFGMYSAFRSFRVFDSAKTAWLLFFIGFILFFLGETFYGYLELISKIDVDAVFPTIADCFWIAGYAPIIIALSLLIRGYKRSGLPMGNWKKYLAGGFLIIGLSTGFIILLLIPMIRDQETRLLTKVVSLFYPVGDLFLIVPAVMITLLLNSFGQSRMAQPWRYLSMSFMAMSIADLLYSYLSWTGKYQPGNFTDYLWNGGYLLAALAGFCQKELRESLEEKQ